KGDGARHQAEQGGIVGPVGVVHHFVEYHARVRQQAEHRAVDEGDAERGVRSGLDHIALLDVFTIVQNDRDTVADGGRGADQLGHIANDLVDTGAAVGLCVL